MLNQFQVYKKKYISDTKKDSTVKSNMIRREEPMGKSDHLDPKSQKVHQLWTRLKHSKSQVKGQSEITLHNRLLRSEAKARQF
jgi:hypothetical protein